MPEPPENRYREYQFQIIERMCSEMRAYYEVRLHKPLSGKHAKALRDEITAGAGLDVTEKRDRDEIFSLIAISPYTFKHGAIVKAEEAAAIAAGEEPPRMDAFQCKNSWPPHLLIRHRDEIFVHAMASRNADPSDTNLKHFNVKMKEAKAELRPKIIGDDLPPADPETPT